MLYKAMVTERKTRNKIFIESEYLTKQDFIKDLRGNGYLVDPSRVKSKEEFDRIIAIGYDTAWKPRKYK